MGQAMRAAGYATFAVGKWHLDGNPVEGGFTHHFGHLSGASDYSKRSASHRLDNHPFEPPTNVSSEDWVLLLDDAARKYPNSGQPMKKSVITRTDE